MCSNVFRLVFPSHKFVVKLPPHGLRDRSRAGLGDMLSMLLISEQCAWMELFVATAVTDHMAISPGACDLINRRRIPMPTRMGTNAASNASQSWVFLGIVLSIVLCSYLNVSFFLKLAVGFRILRRRINTYAFPYFSHFSYEQFYNPQLSSLEKSDRNI